MTNEIQHARAEVKVTFNINKMATPHEREAALKAFFQDAIEDSGHLDFRVLDSVSLERTETEAEASERIMAEMEMAHEREQERRFAEHVDRNGYF